MAHKIQVVLCSILLLQLAYGITPKIANGSPAPQGKYPQVLAFQYLGDPVCGASVLNENWALTAAGCNIGEIYDVYATLYAGSVDRFFGGTNHSVLEIINHENYSSTTKQNDIALVRVSPPFDLSDVSKVAPVVLPEAGFDAQDGTAASIVGWGQLTANTNNYEQFLREAEISTISDSDASCAALITDTDQTTVMCAGAVGTGVGNCYGDNGGPLLVDGVQLGIVSWSAACVTPDQPTIFTQVSAYVDWINSHIN